MSNKQEAKTVVEILNENINFESERLKFIPAWNVQTDVLIQQANDQDIANAIGPEFPFPYTSTDAVSFLEYCKNNWKLGKFTFAIIDKETGNFCGMVGIKKKEDIITNIGYWLGKSFWGKGVATETLITTLKFIKDNFRSIKSVHAYSYKYNLPSQLVLHKCGFVFVNEEDRNKTLKNGQADIIINFVLNL